MSFIPLAPPSTPKILNPILKPTFRADIEGLRAIAILLVVAYHADVPYVQGGFIGVDIFFVLSGYLITWILVYEAESTGSINLPQFYARRARRLLPALTLILIITCIVGALILAPFEQQNIATSALYTSTYISNFYFASESLNYLGTSVNTNPFLHTWSLGVEEQFYIIWPLFIMLLILISRRKPNSASSYSLIVGMALIAILSFLASLYLTGTRQPWAFFLSPSRAWEFAAGALILLIPTINWSSLFNHQNPSSLNRPLPKKFVGLMGWLGLLGIIFSACSFSSKTTFPGIAVLLPVLSTALVLYSGAFPSKYGPAILLNTQIFQILGRLSYSWYLWHWPLLVLATLVYGKITLKVGLAIVISSLIISAFSYYFVENPIRCNKWLAQRSKVTLGFAFLLITICVLFSYSWQHFSAVWAESPAQIKFTTARNDLERINSLGCHLNYFKTQLTIEKCTFGDKNSEKIVVLFGDSHAEQWFPPLEKIATNQGWKLISLTKSNCSFVDITTYPISLGRQYLECDQWRKNVVQKIQELHPYIVILSTIDNHSFTEAEWVTGMEKVLTAIQPVTQNVILVKDTPKMNIDVPTYLARKVWNPEFWNKLVKITSRTNPKVSQLMTNETKKYEHVYVLDMNPIICPNMPCALEQNNHIMLWDNQHLTRSFSLSLAPDLLQNINLLLGK